MMRLAQGQLNLLATCPRRFQHIYLDQLGSPTTFEQQEHQAWGTQFHLLMQQHELGLPISSAASAADDRLYPCVQALLDTAPELFQQNVGFRQSEHRRTLHFQGYLLTTIYDLLILNSDSAQIVDWKTYPRPQNTRWLSQHWQTRLYPFVLAETSGYLPEQISIAYWFVQASRPSSPVQPQSLKFTYSTALHEQTRQDLTRLLGDLNRWLQCYLAGEPFPQVAVSSDRCGNCHFNRRCDRDQEQATQPTLLNLAEVEEVAI